MEDQQEWFGVDTEAFTEVQYEHMLNEVRERLPLFLQRGASERHDQLGDVQGLTGLHPEDLARVIAVHTCLSDQVQCFAGALSAGLRRPVTASVRPREVTQTVRGPIDWAATVRARSSSGGDTTLFVVRPGRKVFDTPENRALAWALKTLERAALRALRIATPADAGEAADGWHGRLQELLAALRRAWRVDRLRDIPACRPDAWTLKRLSVARSGFYRLQLGHVIRVLLRAEDPDAQQLVDTLSARYFVPDKAWRLYEVLVALRLADAFADPRVSDGPRLARLLAGAGSVEAYARYRLHGGDEIRLIYQGWPRVAAPSVRQRTATRHGFTPGWSIPDLMVMRTGAQPDCVVLELKATRKPGYLGAGLTQLLGYLGERPSLFGPAPAGWLVAPASDVFTSSDPVPGEPLWVVAAEDVAAAAADRLGH